MQAGTRVQSPCRAIGVAVGMFALVAAGMGVARAAEVSKEIATARQHAEYAADSSTIEMLHAHLHHTINCLVGPGGDAFDPEALNPCAVLGGGAIPDASAESGQVKKLRSALDLAEAGLKTDELEKGQSLAARTAAELAKAE